MTDDLSGENTMKSNKRILFFSAFVLFHLAANFAHPVTPGLIVERGLDSSMFGVALAAMMTMNFLFSPLWGKLCNYVPTRRIMAISAVGYGLGQIFFLFARTEAVLLAGRLFAGVFVGGAFTGFSNYIVNTAPDPARRDRDLVVLVTVQSVASACGYFIGGMLGLISIETAIVAQILCLILSGILFRLFCLDDTPFKEKPQKALSLREANPFLAFANVKAFMTPAMALIFGVVAVSSIGQNSYEQCFNYYIKDQFGMSSAYNGTFKAIIALVTLALNATVVLRLKKQNGGNGFLYVLGICTGLTALILLFRDQYLFVGGYILYSSVNVIRLPLLQSIIAGRATARSRNSLMGFHQSMNSLGGIFGALFAGLIYKLNPMLPFGLAFLAYGAALVLGGIYALRANKS